MLQTAFVEKHFDTIAKLKKNWGKHGGTKIQYKFQCNPIKRCGKCVLFVVEWDGDIGITIRSQEQ